MSPAYDFDLVCIGSGPSGQRAAVQAAKLGKRAAVVEKGLSVGGTCLDRGTIPSKTFREAVCSLTQGDGQFGRSHASRSESDRPHRPSAEELLHRVAMVARREAQVVEQQQIGRAHV